MAKSKGRDNSITRGTLPLDTTRSIRLSPVSLTFPAPQVQGADYAGPVRLTRIIDTPSVVPAGTRRIPRTQAGNDNLYRPSPVTKAVKVCQDRNSRREVIFALGKGGRNGMKKARHTQNSKVKC